LPQDLQRFNAYYIDKEEDAVIRLQVGAAAAAQACRAPSPPLALCPLSRGAERLTVVVLLPLLRRR
jgi:hypothetical protein